VRSNNVSKPVDESDIFCAWKRPRDSGSGRAAGDVVGVQSIASSSSSRECDRDCDCGSGMGVGEDDALGDGGLKVAGLSEG
jgi:hypothetical protein